MQNKESVKELFGIVSEKVANRPGGYTRIIKLGNRLGDNAEICFIELVDFNETMLAASAEKAGKTRRSRRGGAKKEEGTEAIAAAPVVEAPSAEVVEDAVVVEEVVAEEVPVAEEVVEVVAETEVAVEEVAAEEVVAEEAPAAEEPTDAPATEEPTEEKGEDA